MGHLASVLLVRFASALTLASLALYVAMMGLFVRALRRRSRPPPPMPEVWPWVSILKPLAGKDDGIDENLESFTNLTYPCFEILLGIASRSDPAYEVARRFIARHPSLDIRIVLTDPDAALNPKVAQLLGLQRVARGSVYVISDSNVRVAPTYLASMVAPLTDSRVGLVHSLFSGTGERSLGAALENLQICASTAPGIAAMDCINRPLTVGKSMAMRRRDVEAVGGFSSVGGVLAEDHWLGRRFIDAGFEVRLSTEVVENWNVGCSVRRTIERHTRWAKMRRSLFPYGFCVEPMLAPTVVATGALLVAPSRVTACLLVAAAVIQTAGALLAVRLLRRSPLAWRYVVLEVVRSYVSVLCWFRACASRSITWRGHPFIVLGGSTIVPVSSGTEATPRRERQPA